MTKNTVNSTHELYDGWLPLAQKCRTVEQGDEAIKEARQKYLPVPSSMKANPELHKTYIERATFFNVTAKTRSNYAGAILRRDPQLFVSDSVKAMLDDSTLANQSVYDLIRLSVNETLNPGRFAILVDYDNEAGRPKISTYVGENVINWRHANINGKFQLVMVVLREEVDVVDPSNPFDTARGEMFRVLFIDPMDGIYKQRLFREAKDKWDDAEIEITPSVNGEMLRQIPITFFNASSNEVTPENPLLLDVVNMNLSHFVTTMELEHAVFWSAMPTPVITGVQTAPDKPLVIGSPEAWILPDTDAKADILEFTGAAVKAIQDVLQSKEEKLSAIGTRLLDPTGNETARAASFRQGAETATLIDVVNSLENGWDRVLQLFSMWSGDTTQVARYITFNRDFVDNKLQPAEIDSLIKAWREGAISSESLYAQLRQGEVIAPDSDPEVEVARLNAALNQTQVTAQ